MRLIVYLLVFACLGFTFPPFKYQLLALTLQQVLLIQNMPDQLEIPRNFRIADNQYLGDRLEALKEVPSRKGLDYLQISGSSQFSQQGLKAILAQLPTDKKLVVVDLRQESHGFVNGMATSWYGDKDWANIGKTSQQIKEDERFLLEMIREQGKVVIYTDKFGTEMLHVNVDSIYTEENLAALNGLEYKRFYVTDHVRPSDLDVQEFLDFVNQLPENYWLHFHCAAGKGRTTTFMVLYDIYKNAKEVSFEDIIKRQWLIGGHDLSHLSPKEWKQGYAIDRYFFLKYFYEFCRAETESTSESWIKWVNLESYSPAVTK